MTSVTDSVSSRGARGLHWRPPAIDRKCHNVCIEAVIDGSTFRAYHMIWNRAELVGEPPSASAAAIAEPPQTSLRRAAGNQQMTSVTDSVSSRGARGLHWPTTAIDRKCHNVCVEAVIDDSAFRRQHMIWNRAGLVCKPPSASAAAVVSKPTTAATRVPASGTPFPIRRSINR